MGEFKPRKDSVLVKQSDRCRIRVKVNNSDNVSIKILLKCDNYSSLNLVHARAFINISESRCSNDVFFKMIVFDTIPADPRS